MVVCLQLDLPWAMLDLPWFFERFLWPCTASRYGKPCQTHFEAVAHVVETPEGPAAWLPCWLGVGVGLGGWLVPESQSRSLVKDSARVVTCCSITIQKNSEVATFCNMQKQKVLRKSH